MIVSELREKTTPELKQEILELSRERFNLRMQKSMGEAPASHQLKKIRRTIARIKTIIVERGPE